MGRGVRRLLTWMLLILVCSLMEVNIRHREKLRKKDRDEIIAGAKSLR